MTQAMTIGNAMAVNYTDFGGNAVSLDTNTIRNYITPNANVTDGEVKFFLELCKARRMNPFLKEAYLVKYGDKPASIIVSKDAFMKRADANASYDGMEDGIIVVDKETGDVIERAGTFYLKLREVLVGGWCKVYIKGRAKPVYKAVAFEECSSGQNLWTKQPAVMVNKVAIVRALRDAFPNDFAQCYSAEEMETSDDVDNRMIDDDDRFSVPAEVEMVEPPNGEVVEQAQDIDIEGLRDLYIKGFRALKTVDGGKMSDEHTAALKPINDRIAKGDNEAYGEAIAYMDSEYTRLTQWVRGRSLLVKVKKEKR